MTINELPSYVDYAATMPTPVIVFAVSLLAIFILTALLFFAMDVDAQPWITATFLIGAVASVVTAMFSLNVAQDEITHFRADALSQHLEETYGVDVGFGEDGVRPDTLDGNTVHDGDSVYQISVATDGSILLVDDGGKEVPRISQ